MIITNSKKEIIAIGQYKILKPLVKSGFSFIYLVEDTQNNNKQYILKLLKSSKNIQRIDNEIKILKFINKIPHKIQLYKVQKIHNSFIYIFEYASGGNLRKKIDNDDVLSEKESEKMVRDIFKTLKYTHQKDIIHRDIKPENIVINDDKYYLIDWNISLIGKNIKTLHIKNDDDITAPEVFYGEFNKAFDIYSLGCTLYYVLTGKNIYDIPCDTSFVQTMYSHIYLEPDIPEKLSDKMKYLLIRMLEKNPKNRANINECEDILNGNFIFENLKKNNQNNNIDFENKIELYTKMAKDNISYAQNILGLIYHEGYIDVKQDINEALYWYTKASNLGLSKADFNLGLLYFDEKNYEKAIELFDKASKNNHEKAYYYLGLIYENGFYVESDLIIACEYYKKSAFFGFREAHKKAAICKASKEYLM